MSHAVFQPVPFPSQDDPIELRRVLDEAIRAINLLGRGKLGCDVDVTLDANQATTTVLSPLIGAASSFLWTPRTASAVAELVANGPPLAIPATDLFVGKAVFTHVNSATSDRDFSLCVLG